jgi:serine/threonine protein kinase
MSYKQKYYKYKQKYMNLLYGGANNKLVIRHKRSGVQITSLPFKRDTDYVDKGVLTLPLVQTMSDGDKQELEKLLEELLEEAQVKKQEINIEDLDRIVRELRVKIENEERKDKENIDPMLLLSIKAQHQALLQQKQEIEKTNKIMSDRILQFLLQYFIENFHILIDGIHNYTFNSYVTMGGQGIVFRIVKSETGERHIIKFAIYDNCYEIKHEAETLEKYYEEHGVPTTFRPYKPLLYHDGADVKAHPVDKSAMDIGADTSTDIRSMCFAIYKDVGNEDLLTFIRRCNTLGASNPSSQELIDRIRMIPHILLQIALQLEYYKKYRHNDIRLENIVVDIRGVEQGDLMGQDEPVGPVKSIYKGNVLKLVRVAIIDFGKFNAPNVPNFSLAYISSPEALEQEFIGPVKDKQRSDLIGFCWVANDLLTLSQSGYSIMEKTLIKRVLSKEQNYQIIALGLGTHESIKRKALLFIYQLLMHNSSFKSPMSKIFDGMFIDTKITFDNLLKLIFTFKKDKIKEILFQNDNKTYDTIIKELIILLFPIYTPTNKNTRASIIKIIEWLHKQFPVLGPIPPQSP